MKTILTILLAGATGLGLSACYVHGTHGHGGSHSGHGGVEIVVPSGHYHSHDCGHYHHGDRWYYSSNHRHGAGCGHVFIGGRWTLKL